MKDHLQKQPTALEKKLDYQLAQIIGYINRVNDGATALARHILPPEEMAKLLSESGENSAYQQNLELALQEIFRAEHNVEVSEETKATIDNMAIKQGDEDDK